MIAEQKSIRDVAQVVLGSGANLSAAAAILAFLSMVMPFVGAKTNIGMGLDRAGSINAFAAAGWVAWLALAVFVLAAASRRVPALSAYSNIIDFTALGASALTLVWAWFFNPVKAEMGQIEGLFGGAANGVSMVTLYPHIGMAVLVVSCGVLLFARKKA